MNGTPYTYKKHLNFFSPPTSLLNCFFLAVVDWLFGTHASRLKCSLLFPTFLFFYLAKPKVPSIPSHPTQSTLPYPTPRTRIHGNVYIDSPPTVFTLEKGNVTTTYIFTTRRRKKKKPPSFLSPTSLPFEKCVCICLFVLFVW